MSTEQAMCDSPTMETLISELQAKVVERYPDARFEVFEGEDPKGTYLRAIVDVEDTDEIVNLVVDRLLDLQVEQRVPLYFVASRPPERLERAARPAQGTHSAVSGRAFLP